MTIHLDNQTIDIPCSRCGKKIKERIGRLKRDPKLTCSCGHVILVEAHQLRNVTQAVDKLNKSLGNLRAVAKKLK